MIKFLKSWALVISMVLGVLLQEQLLVLAPAIPYLLAIMLFVSFSKVDFSTLKLGKLHYTLFTIQILASVLVYMFALPLSVSLAQGAMVCILIPTAASAAAVVALLGGNVSSIAIYTLFNSVFCAVLIPIIFSAVGISQDLNFIDSLLTVCKSVIPMIFIPLLLAWVINKFLPLVKRGVTRLLPLSFYLWASALMILTGKTVHSLVNRDRTDEGIMIEISLAAASLIICIAQFVIGRKIGKRYGMSLEAGQCLGQKNTIFGIWLAQMYLVPYASLAPACYVLWQNVLNSYEVWKARKKSDNQ